MSVKPLVLQCYPGRDHSIYSMYLLVCGYSGGICVMVMGGLRRRLLHHVYSKLNDAFMLFGW